jgi:hypothetical protein
VIISSVESNDEQRDLELVYRSFISIPKRDQGRRLNCRRSDGSRVKGSTKTVSFVPKIYNIRET